MQRSELILAIHRINEQIAKTGLFKTFEEYQQNRHGAMNDSLISNLLRSLRDFSYWTRSAGPAVSEVLTTLELVQLDDIELWTILAKEPDADSEDLFRIYRSLFYAKTYLPKIAVLLERDADRFIEHPEYLDNQGILRVIAVESTGSLSKPERIVAIIKGISELYAACAILESSPDNDLSLLACDSGSDKSFDFLGLAKVIECVKSIILSLWDKVVFFRERKLAARLELIAESLPVIDRINEMETTKALPPEQAEILRRNITASLGALLNSGILIPEINNHVIQDPRRLMSPEPKLLAAGPSPQETSVSTPKSTSKSTSEPKSKAIESDDNLTEDERKVFTKLLAKSQRKKKAD